MNESELSALALVCTLKPSPEVSSSQLLAEQLLEGLRAQDVRGEAIRVVDFDVRPGVSADEGDGDQWPELRKKVLAADILIVSTPTWMGHMSSVAQRVLERLDAELAVFDDAGRAILAGKVAVAAVVGNEDGAHKIIADLFQALDDVGYTIPSQGGTYWNGVAMHKKDYLDLEETPEEVATANRLVVTNAVHLARALRAHPYAPAGK
jgi:multimeric flavodoxin WrbA